MTAPQIEPGEPPVRGLNPTLAAPSAHRPSRTDAPVDPIGWFASKTDDVVLEPFEDGDDDAGAQAGGLQAWVASWFRAWGA